MYADVGNRTRHYTLAISYVHASASVEYHMAAQLLATRFALWLLIEGGLTRGGRIYNFFHGLTWLFVHSADIECRLLSMVRRTCTMIDHVLHNAACTREIMNINMSSKFCGAIFARATLAPPPSPPTFHTPLTPLFCLYNGRYQEEDSAFIMRRPP